MYLFFEVKFPSSSFETLHPKYVDLSLVSFCYSFAFNSNLSAGNNVTTAFWALYHILTKFFMKLRYKHVYINKNLVCIGKLLLCLQA
jgi:hypothetical protein